MCILASTLPSICADCPPPMLTRLALYLLTGAHIISDKALDMKLSLAPVFRRNTNRCPSILPTKHHISSVRRHNIQASFASTVTCRCHSVFHLWLFWIVISIIPRCQFKAQQGFCIYLPRSEVWCPIPCMQTMPIRQNWNRGPLCVLAGVYYLSCRMLM